MAAAEHKPATNNLILGEFLKPMSSSKPIRNIGNTMTNSFHPVNSLTKRKKAAADIKIAIPPSLEVGVT